MKKNLILPISGLIILGLCAFFFLVQTEPKDPKSLELPPSLFETTGFYEKRPLKKRSWMISLSSIFLHHGANHVLQNTPF